MRPLLPSIRKASYFTYKFTSIQRSDFYRFSNTGPRLRDVSQEKCLGHIVPVEHGAVRAEHGGCPVFSPAHQLFAHSSRGVERGQLGIGEGESRVFPKAF